MGWLFFNAPHYFSQKIKVMELGKEIEANIIDTVERYGEETGTKGLESKGSYTKKGEMIADILALDVACYALFHTAYISQYHYDNLITIRRRYINEYEEKFSTKFVDVNSNAY